MGRKAIDLTGQRFGKLLVLGRGGADGRNAAWLTRCDCGVKKLRRGNELRTGRVRSCGCEQGNHKHGLNGTSEHKAWSEMRQRCENPNHSMHYRYGGRGIRVCERWRSSFEAFFADVGPKPSPVHSIERIDNDGNYEPGNCRWATKQEQARNRSSNRIVKIDGRPMTVAEAAELTGIPYKKLWKRVDSGMSIDRALTQDDLRTKV